jgi:hypothetical protein
MERELTQFQTECEERLTAALAKVGRRVADRRLDGISETYVTGSIEGRDITFWIYMDGADFHAGTRHRVFERPDYDSLDALAGKFAQELAEAAV